MDRRPARISLLLLPAVAVVLGMAIWLAASPASGAADHELSAARARWAANAPGRYRLLVSEETAGGGCRQDVQIAREQIVAVLRNECVRMPSWTVTNLFTWIDGLQPRAARCYPSDVTCVCYAVYAVQARYDPQLGYPQQITYSWVLQANWAYAPHWERLWRAHEWPACSGVAAQPSGYITIAVLALAPLP